MGAQGLFEGTFDGGGDKDKPSEVGKDEISITSIGVATRP